MTHFGMISPSSSGHLYPLFALSQELKKRGHQITFFGFLDVEKRALDAGLNFCPLGESEYPLGYVNDVLERMGQMNGLDALRFCIQGQCKEANMLLNEAPKAIKKRGIDALLIDQIILSGETVAEIVDLPFITVCNALILHREDSVPPYFTPWNYHSAWWASLRNRAGYWFLYQMAKPITKVVNKHRLHWKLPPYSYASEPYSKLLQLTQQPIEFEFPRNHLPQCLHFTGPLLNPTSREPIAFPFDKLTGQPLIYASLGTVQNQLKWIFNMIAEACVGIDAQLVLSLGGSMNPDALPKLPGNSLVVGYAPQLALLKKASLTITHAGMNTTLECLSNGVPMVAIPITNDQPGAAARIVWTGTGEAITLSRLDVSRLRAAIQQVLTDDSYQINALRLQRAIDQAGGVSHAANLIEQAISTGKPVWRDNGDIDINPMRTAIASV